MLTRWNINRILIQLVVIISLLGFSHSMLIGQDGPERVYMYLNFYQIDGNRTLITELKYRPDKIFLPVSDVRVEFYRVTDTSELSLGEVITNEDGKATLVLNTNDFITDTSGSIAFNAVFSGTEAYRKASRDLTLKEISMQVDAEVVDSIKTLNISCSEIKNDEEIPINDVEVQILVKRLYSNLPVATANLEDGEMSVQFPDDLPGGHFGELEIICRIANHDDYGTIETHKVEQWGTPVSFIPEKKPRALWSRAPLWIIIAMALALGAAWYHYFLSLSKLLKIRKL